MGTTNYPAESIGSRMTTHVPTCKRHDKYEDILKLVTDTKWESTRNVYVIDSEGRLHGYIDVGDLLTAKPGMKAEDIMREPTETLRAHADQEKAVFMAVRDDVLTVPVVDKDDRFLGTITAHSIIDIMHEEHMEDSLLSAGIRGHGLDVVKLARQRAGLVFKTRAPWLLLGLMFGLGLGFIVSFFEETLNSSIALAYFIPVVAYIAGAVGTQTGTITVRTLNTLRPKYFQYAIREIATGMMLGATLGTLSGFGALLISGSSEVGITVGLALFLACTTAALLSSSVPFLLEKLGKDPALGSGPIANALQDTASIIIYFVVAVLVITS